MHICTSHTQPHQPLAMPTIYQIMLQGMHYIFLWPGYGNFEGLKMTSYMLTPKHSLLAKTIIQYLNGTNSQATNMQVSLTCGTLYNLPNPTNAMTGVMLQRECNINTMLHLHNM